jgi:amphiphysin
MQSVQRQFGRLMNRGPGENAKVSVLLNDYEDADKVLGKVSDLPNYRRSVHKINE